MRVRVLLAVVVVLVAGGLADRAGRPVSDEGGGESVFSMPVAADASALSSTWYCAAATAVPAPNGFADGSVIVANPGTRPVTGTVTFASSDEAQPPVEASLDVPAHGRQVVRHQDHIRAPYAAALVELDGGGVVVEHAITGPLGNDVAPCASSPSDRWYFADGATFPADANMVLALYNPFPEDAIVDLSFSTSEGRVVPQALQAVVVKGGRLLPVNVGEHVIRRKAISTSVVARSGRLVVDRIQVYGGGDGRKGLGLVLGAPSPGRLWYFPEGFLTNGIVERFQLYNPTDREARVSLEVALEQGAAEPFDIVIGPQGRHTQRLDADARVKPLVGHAVTVRATEGAVVAERSIDAARPSERAGLSSTMGARFAARQWVFPAGLVTDQVDEWVMVMNPGQVSAEIRFTALAGQPLPVADLQAVRLDPGRRKAIRLGDHVRRDSLPLLVTSTEPIVAERGLYRTKALGISLVMGIPLRD